MIVKDKFTLDDNRREKLTSLEEDYPYVCLDVTLDKLLGRSWHWHNAFEIDLILDGEMELTTTQKTLRLYPGDIVFINSCILHDARAFSLKKDCRLYAQLFEPVFLSGMFESRLEKNYIRPILGCPALDVWVFRKGQDKDMADLILKLIHINETEPVGSGLLVRSGLSELWCILLQRTMDFRQEKNRQDGPSADTERLRTMIHFIRDHFMDEIRVADIAQSANISLRECHRCFQRNIGVSPNAFLTDYRLRISAHMLKGTDSGVAKISSDCGFASQSYFAKLFKDMFGCTPLEYRKK